VASTHGIDEDVGRRQVSGGFGMSGPPPFKAGQCLFFPLRARDFYQRVS
jgi:hypothetical protein